jgi:hypothetical protein
VSRGTFVIRNGELVEKGGPLDIRPVPARSHLPSPMLNMDSIGDLRSMADGKIYSSKSALRRGYKAAGVVEMGSDAPRSAPAPKRERITKDDIGRAIQKVKQGYKPAPLETESSTSWQE